MPCEPYKVALIEAAATGLEPKDELRAHLINCAACRAAFAQEQSLFSSIDFGLHAAANAEVPASLLPRVRAGLTDEPAPRRLWTRPLIFAAASVALAFAIFLLVRPHHTRPDTQAKQTPQLPLSETSAANARGQNPGSATQIASSKVKVNNPKTPGHSTFLRPVASSQPEVLVPPDEREAFSSFVATLHERGGVAVALVTPSSDAKGEPAGLKRLQIDSLEVKPLGGTESEKSSGAENMR